MSSIPGEGARLDPVRTCLGCRQRVGKSALLRIVVRNGELVVDASATLPGRGAWVHPARECIATAITRRAFGRAFRSAGALDGNRLRQVLTDNQASPVGASSEDPQ